MQTPGQIEARAGVRRDRGLRLHVLKGLTEYVLLRARSGLDCYNHSVEGIVFRRHEAFPAHHGKLRTAFRLPGSRLRPGLGKVEQGRPCQRASRRKCGAALKKSSASKVMHSL